MDKRIRLTTGGDYFYTLDKPGQVLDLRGRFKLANQDRLNLTITVIHQAPHTQTNLSLKATVDDQAYAVIRGNILVDTTAVGTESFLEQRVLLLSSQAKAEAIPNLEIKTNEVKCSHAATVGQIDADQIFYLNSRGIDTKTAKTMIASGFLE